MSCKVTIIKKFEVHSGILRYFGGLHFPVMQLKLIIMS